MSCSAFVSYQVEENGGVLPGVLIKSERLPPANASNVKRKPVGKHTATSFVLVDPSNAGAKGGGKDARSSIRKHASKACAAQRLATIAEKKKSLNQLSKREQQRQQAAERLEVALQEHARKFAPIKEELASAEPIAALAPEFTKDDIRACGRRTSDSSDTLSSDTLTSLPETRSKKCSIPWLLAPSPPSGEALHKPKSDPTSEETPTQQVVQWRQARPGNLDILSNLKDQMRYTAFDFPIDDRVCFLMHLMTNFIYDELMELRLPTKADKEMGRPNLWRTIMPQLLLSSEPFFWATVLCAGTLDALHHQRSVALDEDNIKYRDLAITCVNKRFRVPADKLVFDCGLISAIASLGIWERQCGSKKIWGAHYKGVETLLERLREAKEDRLVAQIIASCRDEVPNVCTDDHSLGFQRFQSKGIDLDPDLVSSICLCPRFALIQPNEHRLELLESTATEILKHTVVGTMSKKVAFPNRILLETHVLLQGAGVSMINFVAGDATIANVDQIDLPETCREAVHMATSVFSDSNYDEILLWALFTIHALNDNAEAPAVRMISRVIQRLQVRDWHSLEGLLRSFAYLECATGAYRSLWSTVEMHVKACPC